MTNLKNLAKHIINRFSQFINTHENGLVGRQRLVIFVYTAFIILLGIPLNLIGLTGPSGTYYLIQNLIHFVLSLLIYVLYYQKRITLVNGLSSTLIISQLVTSAEMIYCAFTPTDYHLMLIVGNLLLSLAIIFFAICSYLTITPYILGSMSISSYMFCTFYTQDSSLSNFAGIFIILYLVTALMGYSISNKSLLLQKENQVLKSHEESLLTFFNMNKEEFDAYTELSRNKHLAPEKQRQLLEAMGEKTKTNLFQAVTDHIRRERTTEEIIAEVFSYLTVSEREICRLILQNKTTGEICNILDKTPGNITSQRTHIRNKLGLRSDENLKQKLQQIMTDKGYQI